MNHLVVAEIVRDEVVILLRVGNVAQNYSAFAHYREKWQVRSIPLGSARYDVAQPHHLPMVRHVSEPRDAGGLVVGVGVNGGGHICPTFMTSAISSAIC